MNITIPSKNSQQEWDQPSTQKLCPRHRSRECIFLSTDPTRTDDLVFKCDFCVVEQTIQPKYLLPIYQLATSDLKTVFWHWPLPDNCELLEKVRALSTREKPDTAYKQKIESFFKQMRTEVMARIDEVQAAMNKRAETLWDFDHTILEQYSQLSAKQALKSAVLDNSEGLEQLSARIRRTVTGVLSGTESAAASLASSLNQLELQESAVDFSGPQIIKDEILASISKISMFLGEDMQDLQMQPGQLQQMEAEAEGNLDVILRLASCRFNDLSEGFRERMCSQLQKFRKVFDKIELGNAREEIKRVAEFESLEEEEVREVKAFAERLIEKAKRRQRGENGNSLQVEELLRLLRNKANHLSQEMIEKSQALLEGVSRYVGSFEVDSIHQEGFEQEEQFEGMSDSEIRTAGKAIQEMKELLREGEQEKEALQEVINVGKKIARSMAQPQQQNARNISADKIMELVKNETNFCSEEYVHSLEAALKGVHYYLESFQLAERENEGLDGEQLSTLGKLGSKIKDLNVRYGDSYKRRLSPIEEEQPQSVIAVRWLKNHVAENCQKELDSLLCKLPIFEMTECDWKGIPVQWKWMKTGYEQSSSLKLDNEGNGVRVTQTIRCNSQAVTESTLDNNLVYSVKCTFNKPLNGASHFIVGLVPDNNINSEYLGNGRNGTHFFWSSSSNGLRQVVKGQLLNSAALNTTLTTILFRFCIQTQTFMQSDPTLQNINSLDKSKIDPNTKYRFGICFYSHYFNNNGYSCLISDVMTSTDQTTVDKF